MSLLRMRCKVQSSFERVNFVEAEGMEEIENDGDIGVRSSLLYIEQVCWVGVVLLGHKLVCFKLT